MPDAATGECAGDGARQPLLPFSPGRTAADRRARTVVEIAALLDAHLTAPVAVELHKASREPIRIVRHGPAAAPDRYRLRLHHALADAPDALFEDLAAWIRHGRRARGASDRLDAYLAQTIPQVRRAPRAAPRGTHHDLDALAGAIDRALLPEVDTPMPSLSWSPQRRSQARSSLQLGCYDQDLHRVRIHPVLDTPAVPAWFLEVLLHHELLHALLPPELRGDGARLHHGPIFRAWEARHPRKTQALRWERKHIRALLAAARRGIPLQPRG